MQTPIEKYRNDLDSMEFEVDPSQEAAIAHLQRLFLDLTVNIIEYHKIFIKDSNMIKNLIKKFEFLIIEKTILN